jgi:hypothetical protein
VDEAIDPWSLRGIEAEALGAVDVPITGEVAEYT